MSQKTTKTHEQHQMWRTGWKPATSKWANYDHSDAGRSYHDQPCLPMHQSWKVDGHSDTRQTNLSHRSRFVAKGYSQVQGLHYFENYAPVASFITLRLLFALTSIPNFQVLQYDVSVAFIQSKLDSNHPPVYCECAEGYDHRQLRRWQPCIHQLHNSSKRIWNTLQHQIPNEFRRTCQLVEETLGGCSDWVE